MADADDLLRRCKRKMKASGSSTYVSTHNRRPIEDAWDFDAVDPAEAAEYYRQIHESDGFDVDIYLKCGEIIPHQGPEVSLRKVLLARVGLHCYNIQKAIDPASGSRHTFQTCVADGIGGNRWKLIAETQICRLKPGTPTPGFEVSGRWDEGAVDDFYKGDMPDWDSDDALTNSEHLYKVQDSDLDLARHYCLHLYCEVALCPRLKCGAYSQETFKSSMPLEIEQAYVQTLEDVKPVWEARNAIFYISFRTRGSAVENRGR